MPTFFFSENFGFLFFPGLYPYGVLVGIEFYRGIVRDIHPNMNVGAPAEIPDKGRPLESPVVVNAVIAQVTFLVEGQVTTVESAAGGKALEGFLPVGMPEWFKKYV